MKYTARQVNPPVRRAAVIVTVLLLTALAVGWGTFRARAVGVLREGKNAALSLRLLAVYYDEDVFDDSRPSGMPEELERELHRLSEAPGEITLTAWDGERGEPTGLTYTRDGLRARLERDPETGSASWTVEYWLAVLRYK